jgi:tetratricopeptide (TPR) repeat protein
VSFFFPAYFLCWQYVNLYQCDQAALVLGRFQDRQGRLTPYERLLYSERRADLAGRFNEQLRLMRERVAFTPDDLDLKERIGLYHLVVRQPREAAAMLKAISSSRYSPATENVWEPFYFLAHAHHRLGEFEKELVVAQQAGQQFPDTLELRAREVAALAALNRLAEADRTVEAATRTPARMGTPGMLLVMSAVELRAHGRREAARKLADRTLAWFAARPAGEQPAHRPVRVLALFLAARWAEARRVAEALPKSPRPEWDYLTIFWGQPAVYRLGWLGSIAARLGDTAQARRLSAQLREFKSSCPPYDRTYWRAAIAAQLGEKDEAMRLFEEAVAQESPNIWQADHDVLLEPLWGDTRFAALVRPYEG